MDICKNSDYMTQAFLAQVAILVQTITSEFLNWTGRCCLHPALSHEEKLTRSLRQLNGGARHPIDLRAQKWFEHVGCSE